MSSPLNGTRRTSNKVKRGLERSLDHGRLYELL
jgi:hypothetical protein